MEGGKNVSEEVVVTIRKMATKSCECDPNPTNILKKILSSVSKTITSMVNVSIITGSFAHSWKSVSLRPLLNKRSMDLGALLDSCSWYDIGNFLQTCIKNSLLQTKSIEI